MPRMKKTPSTTAPTPLWSYTPTDGELPATQGMLDLVRRELKSEMRAGFHRMEGRFKDHDAKFKDTDSRFDQIDARFNKIDARFNEIDARFSQVDARFNQVDARFDRVDARFERMEASIADLKSDVSRIAILMEEQNSRNRVVLEGLSNLWQRQERVEKRVDGFEDVLRTLARSKN